MSAEQTSYGPTMDALWKEPALPPLDWGSPTKALRERLLGLEVKQAFEGQTVVDEEMARCCVAGLLLLHGLLDESHRISQGNPSTTGSYWHGLMHRREGDFSNAKYWFRRVGDHPAYRDLNEAVREKSGGQAPTAFAAQETWDPFAFIDLCERAVGGGNVLEAFCREIQLLEYQFLFDFTYLSSVQR